MTIFQKPVGVRETKYLKKEEKMQGRSIKQELGKQMSMSFH